MPAARNAVVDQQADHHIARRRRAVGDVLGNGSVPGAVALDAVSHVRSIRPRVPEPAPGSLILDVVAGGARQPPRCGERRERGLGTQGSRSLPHRLRAFRGPERHLPREPQQAPVEVAQLPLDVAGVSGRIGAREVDLGEHLPLQGGHLRRDRAGEAGDDRGDDQYDVGRASHGRGTPAQRSSSCAATCARPRTPRRSRAMGKRTSSSRAM